MRILTFTDMGIGNAIWYLPVLRGLSKHDLTVVCPNQELRDFIDYNINCSFKVQGRYDISVNNFLCQRAQDMKQILGIPKRIGHSWIERRKFAFAFTDLIEMNKDKHEQVYNNMLLDPLGLKAYSGTIKYPDINNIPEYDILLSTKSADPAKDWQHWDELIKRLKDFKIKILVPGEYPLLVVTTMISKCKLFIGNDSGLVKISDNLGIPSIQIFRWWTDCFVRCKILFGTNLIEPSLEDVLVEVVRKLRRCG